MSKKPNIYFSSDFHFTHGDERHGILAFERGNKFKTIDEHDTYIYNTIMSWASKWAAGSKFYFLGDFGDPHWLWIFGQFTLNGIETHFVKGNHDSNITEEMLNKYGVIYHQYPVFLSHKIAVSHQPIGMWDDSINIHGHLHSAILDRQNYINANIHVCNYQPVSMSWLDSRFVKMPKYNRRFLWEPYADDYTFTQEKDDAIYDSSGKIDLSASRLYEGVKHGKFFLD